MSSNNWMMIFFFTYFHFHYISVWIYSSSIILPFFGFEKYIEKKIFNCIYIYVLWFRDIEILEENMGRVTKVEFKLVFLIFLTIINYTICVAPPPKPPLPPPPPQPLKRQSLIDDRPKSCKKISKNKCVYLKNPVF